MVIVECGRQVDGEDEQPRHSPQHPHQATGLPSSPLSLSLYIYIISLYIYISIYMPYFYLSLFSFQTHATSFFTGQGERARDGLPRPLRQQAALQHQEVEHALSY